MSEILPLDPDNLTPSASLNRLRIVDVPGIKIDPHVRGKTAYDLLSSSGGMTTIASFLGHMSC